MHPFRDEDSFSFFRNLVGNVVKEIMSLDNNYVLKASISELEEYFIEKVLIEPLTFYPENKYIKNQTPTIIDVSGDSSRGLLRGETATVPGTKIDIAIPFTGDPKLWRIRASRFSISGYPEINIDNDEIIFSISFPDSTARSDKLLGEIDRQIRSLTDAVNWINNDVLDHNNSAPNRVRQALARKRALAQETIGAIAALGIPIKRAGQEPTFAIPAIRRKKPSVLPKTTAGEYKPEPVLDENEYQHILGILKSMSLVIERNPSSFALLKEEAIRDHFLIVLNGHYEGGATGETFNAAGKTDILIREGNKNVFIAECKFWRGQKGFQAAVNQLLGYLTWRDSKCALLIFNKTKDSIAVRQKMHAIMEALPEHRKTVFQRPDGDARYILVKATEPGKEIIVTTQLYDIPIRLRKTSS